MPRFQITAKHRVTVPEDGEFYWQKAGVFETTHTRHVTARNAATAEREYRANHNPDDYWTGGEIIELTVEPHSPPKGR